MKPSLNRLTPLFVVTAVVVSAFPATAQRPSLTGQWKLNSALSETPKDRIQAILNQPDSAAPTPGASATDPGNGAPTAASTDLRGRAEERRALTREAKDLTLTHDEPLIVIAYNDDRTRVYEINGSEKRTQSVRGDVTVAKATWIADALVVESTSSRGLHVTESYSLAAKSDRLTVAVQVESERLGAPITLTRVYDRVSKEVKAPPPTDGDDHSHDK